MSAKSQMCLAFWLACTASLMSTGLTTALASDEMPLPPAAYASLPSNDKINETSTTGSLPSSNQLNSNQLGARTLSGFASLVAQGSITLRASAPTNCLPGNLREVVADVASKFGSVSVESTHRSSGRNWRAGGARQSLHLSCRAIDFRVRTRARGVMAYLRGRSEVGGLKVYGNGIIHIDNGSRRSW
ncbi:D-Ala-D-Ala carboxypeptidase family metallohydrolase [Microvirga sp. 2YAF29]|uniref:D-Ala-D-Ala carboxypeptidase family metallohydrolase n=1 Tax=Microvirga sp. 2YAF29 TaxID=3233031 RepID=UPI003F989EBD